jgi:hypothetical protein
MSGEGSLVTKTPELGNYGFSIHIEESMPPLSMMHNSPDLKVHSNAEANPNLLIPRWIMLSCFQRYYKKHRKLIGYKAVGFEWGESSRKLTIGPFLWRLS